jgi:hypothetical protein
VVKGNEQYGDILVFKRFNYKGVLIGGHVGLYVAEDETHFYVAGGNESDTTQVVRIAKSRLYACRRYTYVNKPKAAKKYYITPDGAITSNNEA